MPTICRPWRDNYKSVLGADAVSSAAAQAHGCEYYSLILNSNSKNGGNYFDLAKGKDLAPVTAVHPRICASIHRTTLPRFEVLALLSLGHFCHPPQASRRRTVCYISLSTSLSENSEIPSVSSFSRITRRLSNLNNLICDRVSPK